MIECNDRKEQRTAYIGLVFCVVTRLHSSLVFAINFSAGRQFCAPKFRLSNSRKPLAFIVDKTSKPISVQYIYKQNGQIRDKISTENSIT
jgi:hypothetical protein